MSISEVIKRKNEKGQVEYRLSSVSNWEGFDSFVQYLQKHWQAEAN